jgi:hypothetical protein
MRTEVAQGEGLKAEKTTAHRHALLRQNGNYSFNLGRKLRRLTSQNVVLVKQHFGNVSSRAGVGLQNRSDAGFKLGLFNAVKTCS